MSEASPRTQRTSAILPTVCSALIVLVVLAVAGPGLDMVRPPMASASARGQLEPARDFATGYSISEELVWNYFLVHGQEAAFGAPVSNLFLLEGRQVQIFQRLVVVIDEQGDVAVVDLMDSMLPYTQFSGSSVPASNPALVLDAPSRSDASTLVAYLLERVPDDWNGVPVSFTQTYFSAVTTADALPGAAGSDVDVQAANSSVWGLPTSDPAHDPNNASFTYQRFENAVFMHDATSGLSEPMLMGDAFKVVLIGEGLASDLAAQAAGSRYFDQYEPLLPGAIARPDQLPNSDLTSAFNPDDPAVNVPSDEPLQDPFAPPDGGATPVVPVINPNPSVCQGDETISFIPPSPKVGDEVLIAVTSSKQHVFTQLFGTERTTKVREDARSGQLGFVWEWTVTPTFNGTHVYTFYIDSTVPCVTTSFTVAEPLMTATPVPTKTPKPTKTPTETETPTETPTDPPDSTQSSMRLSKRTLRMDDNDFVTVVVNLADEHGDPVSGVIVDIDVDTLDLDGDPVEVNQFTSRSDFEGSVQAELSGCVFSNPQLDRDVEVFATFKDANGQNQEIGQRQPLSLVTTTDASDC